MKQESEELTLQLELEHDLLAWIESAANRAGLSLEQMIIKLCEEWMDAQTAAGFSQ